MGDLVNLRRARKARDRREKEASAQANRVAFGRLKTERQATQAQQLLETEKLDAHKRERPEDPA